MICFLRIWLGGALARWMLEESMVLTVLYHRTLDMPDGSLGNKLGDVYLSLAKMYAAIAVSIKGE